MPRCPARSWSRTACACGSSRPSPSSAATRPGCCSAPRPAASKRPPPRRPSSWAAASSSSALEDGKLLARVSLGHFTVLESSFGDLAADALDDVRACEPRPIQDAIPPVEIPVQIEQSIKIGGLTEGAVVAKPGSLPLEIAVSQVLPVNQRLWVLLQAKAGPWQPAASPAPATKAAPMRRLALALALLAGRRRRRRRLPEDAAVRRCPRPRPTPSSRPCSSGATPCRNGSPR